MRTGVKNFVNLSVARFSLSAAIYISFAHARMLQRAIVHINGSYAGLEATSFVLFFNCVNKATDLNFRRRDSNRDWHTLPFAIQNRAEKHYLDHKTSHRSPWEHR